MNPILLNLLFLQEVSTMGANGRLKSCGSLWKGKCKNGTMLSGSISMGLLGDFNIMVFPNTKKGNATAPDYYVSVKNSVADDDNSKLTSCGSLWKGKCKNGTMLSGSIDVGLLGKFNIMIFPNTKNGNDKAPNYYISVKEASAEDSIPMPPDKEEDDL